MQVGLASLRRWPDTTLRRASRNTRSRFCPDAQNLPNEATNGLDQGSKACLPMPPGKAEAYLGRMTV
jgi:hypothetical protein